MSSNKHLYIIGICGTFMGGVAILARSLGYAVSGSDANVYPPMSTQLAAEGIDLKEGFAADNLDPRPDLVIIGNALSRGNPEVEAVLDAGLDYTSGAQWLAENVLHRCRVLAVAGTHGKTTTASMLAWILESTGHHPGYLIGGIPENFGLSARCFDLQDAKVSGPGKESLPCFVIEADEYDTAFFDKRPKFLHYRPRFLILNNLEFDHADIYPDLAAIKLQFHYLLRSVPAKGTVVVNNEDENLREVLAMGSWSQCCYFGSGGDWSTVNASADFSTFVVNHHGQEVGQLRWDLIGEHNMNNALAAIAAAQATGIAPAVAIGALAEFRGVRRRLQIRGQVSGITVYDDFAHHPTAIRQTLRAVRSRQGDKRIFAVLEARSNTMRMGVHRDSLGPSLSDADAVLLLQPENLEWDMGRITRELDGKARVFTSVDDILQALAAELHGDDQVVIMSNGGFENIHDRLLDRLDTATG